jgi:hypothetical protein
MKKLMEELSLRLHNPKQWNALKLLNGKGNSYGEGEKILVI